MRVLSNDDVAKFLDMKTAIEVVDDAMIKVSQGKATLPLRPIMPVKGGNYFGLMPGAIEEPGCFGVKLVSLYPNNPKHGFSSHQGAMVLFEEEFGAAVAIMNSDLLTAVRTAAASGVATRALARADSRVLTIIGNGEQAEHHLDAMMAVRNIAELRVTARSQEKADTFCALARDRYPELAASGGTDIQALVSGADIVCTTTAADDPLLFGDWIGPGTHLNVIGSSIPSKREIDEDLVLKSSIFVDYRVSTFAQAGEIIAAIEAGKITEAFIKAEIGEVLAGGIGGRQTDDEITLYRSLGIAAQDLACAHYILQQADKHDVGVAASIG